MKKNVMLILTFLMISTAKANLPVIDIPHILETIYNGYQMYQQVQNTIQQIQYQYESTKAQLQNLTSFDFSSIENFKDAMSFVDENLSFIRNTEDALKNMKVTIGNSSYDLSSLYKIPGGVFDELTDLWTREMTDAEKAAIWSKYGLSPKNYQYTKVWKDRIVDGSKKLAALSGTVEKHNQKNAEIVADIVAKAKETNSEVGLSQALLELEGRLFTEMQQISYNTLLIGNLISDKVMSEEHIPPEIQVSDSFLKTFTLPSLEIKGDRD